ncbi:MAG TPA: RHS repeat-associated core domain-containing protein, partial [Thermoanaerobaculia bacterium]|nr:RHS repeat-associated core domain-containing protein [Thermoanaerobaculia bacterium]
VGVLTADSSSSTSIFTDNAPFEFREQLAILNDRLAAMPNGGTSSKQLYEMTSLAAMDGLHASSATLQTLAGGASTQTADSASALLLTAVFQAQPFSDPFTLKNYVRGRWYDPAAGTWLGPDERGYVDSSNLYSFAGGDPVNGRDPQGEANVVVSQTGSWVIAGRNGNLIVIDALVAGFDPLIVQDTLIQYGGMIPYQARGLMEAHGLKWTHDSDRPYRPTPSLPWKGGWGWVQGVGMSIGNGATGAGVALAEPHGDTRGLQFEPTSREQEISKGVTDIVMTLLFLRSAGKRVMGGSPMVVERPMRPRGAEAEPGRVPDALESPVTPEIVLESEAGNFSWRLPGEVKVGSPRVPGHHNAMVAIMDTEGAIREVRQLSSGNQTIFESLWPRWKGLSSHTEARIVSRLALYEGEKMLIVGDEPPCASCKGYMNRAARVHGAEITYQWWENGKLKVWKANGKK